MTTNEPDPETYARTMQLVAMLIEDCAELSSIASAQALTRAVVHDVLDNGPEAAFTDDSLDHAVWQIVTISGHDSQADPFVLEQALFALIDECDLFND